MQPNQYPELPQLEPRPEYQGGTAYLDQIAAPQQVKTMKPWQLWGLIAGVIVALIVFFGIIFSSGGPSTAERYTAYIHRVQALRDVTSESNKTIQNSSLRGLSASTSSILGTAATDGERLAGNAGVTRFQQFGPGSSLAPEFTELETTLNDARLNAVYDQVYSREIGFQITKLRSELNTLKAATRNAELREYYEQTEQNLAPIARELSESNS